MQHRTVVSGSLFVEGAQGVHITEAPWVIRPFCLLLQMPEGLLEVRVIEACNLPRMDWLGGRADPFVRWGPLGLL